MPSATHVPCTDLSQNTFIGFGMFVTLFLITSFACTYIHIYIYRVSQDVFLVLKYTEITQNTYVQS